MVQRQVYWFLAATLVAIALTSLFLIRIESAAVRRARDALRPAPRARPAADRRARVDAAGDLARAARRVRADADGDGLDARPRRRVRRRRGPRCAPTCARSARSRRRRSTTCAACHRRCTRRSSRSSGLESTDRLVPVRLSNGSSASRWTTNATGMPGAIDDTTAHPRLSGPAGGVEQRRPPLRRQRPPWVRLRRQDGASSSTVEDQGKGLGSATRRRRGLGLVAMRERAELLGGTLELLDRATGGTLVRLTRPGRRHAHGTLHDVQDHRPARRRSRAGAARLPPDARRRSVIEVVGEASNGDEAMRLVRRAAAATSS